MFFIPKRHGIVLVWFLATGCLPVALLHAQPAVPTPEATTETASAADEERTQPPGPQSEATSESVSSESVSSESSSPNAVPAEAPLPEPPGLMTEQQVLEFLSLAPPLPSNVIPGLQVVTRETFDAGNISWLMIGALAGLCLMTPGLLFFYCGIRRVPNVSAITIYYLLLMALMSVMWILWIYTMSFARNVHSHDVVRGEILAPDATKTTGNRYIGGFDHVVMTGLESQIGSGRSMYPLRRPWDSVPHVLFMAYQMMFFISVPVPLVVVLSNRLRPGGLALFVALWGTLVYAPIIYWVWGGGWRSGTLDAAGGIPAHVNIGFAALAAACFLSRRTIDEPLAPKYHLRSLVLGTVLFWAGALIWNASRSLRADGYAANAFVTTHLAACAGLLGWSCASWLMRSRIEPVDICAGAISGLAAIAAGSAYIAPQSALIIGILGGGIGCFVFSWTRRTAPQNRALDVFALHAVGGVLGVILTGVFATAASGGFSHRGTPVAGLLAGNAQQLLEQVLTLAVTVPVVMFGTWASLFVVRLVRGFEPVEEPAVFSKQVEPTVSPVAVS